MVTIKFENIPPRQINNLLKLFDYIYKRKNEQRIDEDKLAMLLVVRQL